MNRYQKLLLTTACLILAAHSGCARPAALAPTPLRQAATSYAPQATRPIYVLPQGSNPTPSFTPPPTATPGPWSLYRNDRWGFRFEAPTAYLNPLPGKCGLRAGTPSAQDLALINLGNRSSLSIRKWTGDSLADIADEAMQKLAEEPGFSESDRQSRAVAGETGLEVQYRFGGNSRFGSAVFLIHGQTVYIFNMTAGSFCDLPDQQITELSAYTRMIDTFEVDE